MLKFDSVGLFISVNLLLSAYFVCWSNFLLYLLKFKPVLEENYLIIYEETLKVLEFIEVEFLKVGLNSLLRCLIDLDCRESFSKYFEVGLIYKGEFSKLLEFTALCYFYGFSKLILRD